MRRNNIFMCNLFADLGSAEFGFGHAHNGFIFVNQLYYLTGNEIPLYFFLFPR